MKYINIYLTEKLKIDKNTKVQEEDLVEDIYANIIITNNFVGEERLRKQLYDWLEENKVKDIKIYVQDINLHSNRVDKVEQNRRMVDYYAKQLTNNKGGSLITLYSSNQYSFIYKERLKKSDEIYLYACNPKERIIILDNTK